MTKRTHLVVGAGKMGGALLQGWLSSAVIKAEQLVILDPNPGEAAKEAIKKGALNLSKPSAKLKDIKYILLGIKPQMVSELAPSIAAKTPKGAVIISILAGTSIETLANAFTNQTIIRTMPNTPASIGKGITAYTVGPNVSEEQIQMAERLLAAGGQVHKVDSEAMIDIVTAISGSGPAYIFHMSEALEAAAIKLGMPENMAPTFARQTIIGAAGLLEQTDISASQLRKNVTSPNGTTQAALDVLMGPEGLPALIRATAQAAHQRAKELAVDTTKS